MEFKEKGRYNPEALDYMEKVQPLEFAKLSPLRRLNYLLDVVENLRSDSLQEYIDILMKNYKEKIDVEYIDSSNPFLLEFLEDLDSLKNYPELATYNINFFLNILDLPQNNKWKVEKMEVPQANFLRSFLVPKYVNLKSLVKAVGREEGISIYKKYITSFLISIHKNQEDEIEDLRSLHQKFFEEEPKESESWVVIHSEPVNGKLVFRKDVCLWNESLSDLTDLEFKFLVCCYGDFQGIRSENSHFILTMDHTIAKGDPYCSCIVHDTRIDWKINHPPKEYWDNIWPLHEWQ